MNQERPEPLDLAYLRVALLTLAILLMVYLVDAHTRSVNVPRHAVFSSLTPFGKGGEDHRAVDECTHLMDPALR